MKSDFNLLTRSNSRRRGSVLDSVADSAYHRYSLRFPMLLFVLTCHLAVISALVYVRAEVRTAPDEQLIVLAKAPKADTSAKVEPPPEEEAAPEVADTPENVVTVEPPAIEIQPEEPREIPDSPAVGIEGADEIGPETDVAGNAYGNRTGDGKGKALKRYGGDFDSEKAVSLALDWLARHQEPTGFWLANCTGRCPAADKKDRCTTSGWDRYSPGISGLALLSFLGAGYTHQSGTYQDTVLRALDAILSIQKGDGFFVVWANTDELGFEESNVYMYDHAICLLAISELYILTGDEKLARPIETGLKALYRAQQSAGGFDYKRELTGRNDLSVTGWVVLALVSVRNSGIEVDTAVMEKMSDWVYSMLTPKGDGRYVESEAPTWRKLSMSAIAATALLFLGYDPHEDPRLRKALGKIVKDPPNWRTMAGKRDYAHSMYYWYYGTLATFHAGGKYWRTWNKYMRIALLRNQEKDGCPRGSWAPVGVWGYYGGRVFSTAMGALNLEVYYRLMPLYESNRRIAPAPTKTDEPQMAIGEVVTLLLDDSVSSREKTKLLDAYVELDAEHENPAPIIPLLGSEDMMLRWAAARALRQNEYIFPEVLEALGEALVRETEVIAGYFAECLHILGTVEDIEPIICALERTTHQTVRDACVTALRNLTGRDLGTSPARWRQYYNENVKRD